MPAKLLLHVEQLEDRCTPANFGNPWPDPAHLTLSFAPDGTVIDSGNSSLFSLLGSNTSAWEMQILQAFQTWAVNANINIGVVADSGASFNSGGALQGDPRFGDLRIGAAPFSSGQIAETSPFDGYSAWSGSTIINSNYSFNNGGGNGSYDLFSVFLHEAGHSFGLADNNDLNSVEYQYYQGTYTGLSPQDIAALQAIYGPRQLDQYAGAATPNNSMATAASLPTGQTMQGDISTNSEVEWFKFSAPLLNPLLPLSLEFRTSGISLLAANVSVYNASGHLVASTQSTDPLNGNLVLNLSSLSPLQTYYVKVTSARSDVFGIGTYQMRIANDTLSNINGFLAGTVNGVSSVDLIDPLNLNGSQTLATRLPSNQGTAGYKTDALYQAELVDQNDYDWYAVTAPAYAAGTSTESMLVSVWGINGSVLSPDIQVFNSTGKQLSVTALAEDNYTCVMQLNNASPGATYYIRVNSNTGSSGGYKVAVTFPINSISLPVVDAGSLANAASTSSATLTLNEGGFMHFALSVDGATGTTDGVSMTIYDSNGNVVSAISSGSGNSRSADLWLGAGSYTFVFRQTGTGASPLDFQLLSLLSTDPVGMTPSDSSSGSNNSSTTTTSSSSNQTSTQVWTTSSGTYTAPSSSSSSTSYY